MHRPHEFIVAVAPAHPLGNRQAGERGLDDAGNQLGGGRARFGADMNQPSAFVGFQPLQRIDAHTARTGETFSGLGRSAIGTESSAERRAPPLRLTVRLLRGQLSDQRRQTARGGEPPDRRIGESRFFQALTDALLKGRSQIEQGFGRQFLGADFDQKIAGLRHERPPGSRRRGRASGSRARRGRRNRLGPPPAPACAPAGYNAGARSPKSPCAHPAN